MFGVNVGTHFDGRMCKVVSFLILLFPCLQSQFVGDRVSKSSCKSAWEREGTCVELNQCPMLQDVVNILMSGIDINSRNNQVDVLRKSHCGGTAWAPMVCCPKEHRNLHLVSNQNCGEATVGKISNGKEVTPFEFPWMALIAYRIENTVDYACGGSLINPRYVLTAAHCLKTRDPVFGVRLGEHDIKRGVDCYGNTKCPSVQDITMEKIIIHEGYRDKENDIGLIRLAWSAKPNVNVIPICLPVTPSLRLTSLLGKSSWIAGWGTTETVTFSNVLRKAQLTVIDNAKCQKMFSTPLITAKHISASIREKFCAFGPKGEDSCSGDSGGPLMLTRQHEGEERYIIYGIVSYGSKQCSAGVPSVFTTVDAYLEWILDNLRP